MGRLLGQHFLKSDSALQKIAGSVAGCARVIVEIGPGHGELTRYLVGAGSRVVVIERDRRLASALSQAPSFSSVEVVVGDAIKELPALIEQFQKEGIDYTVVGNIPYYITGRLLRVIGDQSHKPRRTVLLMQKEVAQRICALPPRMNLLAAIVQAWSVPRILFSVPRGAFVPPPTVDSAVVELETICDRIADDDQHKYFLFVRTLFKQPRKTIANNLAGRIPLSCQNNFKQSFFHLRPGALSFEEIAHLFICCRDCFNI